MDDELDIEKEMAESKLEIERLKAEQKRKKASDSIIGIGAFIVILGFLLIFSTTLFDSIMPGRSTNQRVLAVVSTFPITLGIHALYTGVVVNESPGLYTSKKRSPFQYKVFTFLWFVTGLFILYIATDM